MAQIDTNEGDGECKLTEWLSSNKLLKAKQQLIELEVSMDEIKEYNLNFLDGFIKNDLKLDGILASRFSKAVKKLQQKSQIPQKQIVRVVLSQAEDSAIDAINNKYNEVTEYLNKLDKDINILNNISKQNENKINEFRKQIMNKINIRMDKLLENSKKEINKKQQNISLHMITIKMYQSLLFKAQTNHNKLLNDDTVHKSKRKMKILEINKNINHDIMDNKPKFNPMVSIEFDKNKIYNFIKTVGDIINYNYPNPPIFYIKDITACSATIEFNEIKPNLSYNLEINGDGDGDEDDEKKSKWNQFATFKNKSQHLCPNLHDNKQYRLRSKCKNEFGWSMYSRIMSFKTKKQVLCQVVDSLIMTKNEKNIFVRLMNESRSNKNVGNTFKLIYRASRDGWTAQNFHTQCDNKGRTVHIIHSNTNNVFGGYSSISWTSDGRYKPDNNAFLFLIRSSNNYRPQIFNLRNNNCTYAVEHCESQLSKFGNGHDIKILSNSNVHSKSYTNKGAYDMPQSFYLNGGQRTFKVKEIEIFLVHN